MVAIAVPTKLEEPSADNAKSLVWLMNTLTMVAPSAQGPKTPKCQILNATALTRPKF
jgi:hypothetical protein